MNSDVADILGGRGSKKGSSGKANKKSKKKTTMKKPKGMNRELFNLLELQAQTQVPPLIPSTSPFKPKPKHTTTLTKLEPPHVQQKQVHWHFQAFENSARKLNYPADDLKLYHWTKQTQPGDYPFARFNITTELWEYSNEEYSDIIKNEPNDKTNPTAQWTKQQTDLLFSLLRQYDMRWIVVADQYNTQKETSWARKSIEELKFRYYEVIRLLTLHYQAKDQKAAESTTSKSTPNDSVTIEEDAGPDTNSSKSDKKKFYSLFEFDIEHEQKRKQQLELIYRRSKEDEEELNKLNSQLRFIDQRLRKASPKVDLQKKQKIIHDILHSDDTNNKKSEIKDVTCQFVSPGVYLRSSGLNLTLKADANIAVNHITSEPNKRHRKDSEEPCATNSGFSNKFIKKITMCLSELGVNIRPLPTANVVEHYDILRKDVVRVLSLHKIVLQKEYQVHQLREQYKAMVDPSYKQVPFKSGLFL